MTENKTIDCIVYGNGNKFKTELFQPIKNREYIKSHGGLWSSPIVSAHGWKEAAPQMDLGDFETSFKVRVKGKIFTIDALEDLERFEYQEMDYGPFMVDFWPDFEELLERKYVAVHLTEKGQRETRLSHPRNLYGWDCETVYIMDSKSAKPI